LKIDDWKTSDPSAAVLHAGCFSPEGPQHDAVRGRGALAFPREDSRPEGLRGDSRPRLSGREQLDTVAGVAPGKQQERLWAAVVKREA